MNHPSSGQATRWRRRNQEQKKNILLDGVREDSLCSGSAIAFGRSERLVLTIADPTPQRPREAHRDFHRNHRLARTEWLRTMRDGYDIAALEAAADQAIGACDGDARAAICALLVANHHLEAEIDRLTSALSRGFVRGRLKPDEPVAPAKTPILPR